MPCRDVTVVIPSRDRAEVLLGSVRTALAQEEVDVRVLVVLDGTTDDSAERLAALGDERVRVVVKERNEGVSAARNTGVAEAGTTWVAFLDDDDLWSRRKLATQFDAIERSTARWSATGVVTFDAVTGDLLWSFLPPDADQLHRELLNRNALFGAPSSILAPTELLRAVGRFDEELAVCEDWECWIRLSRDHPCALVGEPLVAYRIWPRSVSRNTAVMERYASLVHGRYADRRRELGVADDWWSTVRFLARQDAEAGRRLVAARRFARCAVGGRSARDALRAALVLAAPSSSRSLSRSRSSSSIPAGVASEVRTWLAPQLRGAEPVGASA